jgi:hypothetical protein
VCIQTYQQNSLHSIDRFSCHRSKSSVAADRVLAHFYRNVVEIRGIGRPRLRKLDVEYNRGAGIGGMSSYGDVCSLDTSSAYCANYTTYVGVLALSETVISTLELLLLAALTVKLTRPLASPLMLRSLM